MMLRIMPRELLFSSTSDMHTITAPKTQSETATSFEIVKRSPEDEGNDAAIASMKMLEVVLSIVTSAVSPGSSASWNV